MEADIPEFKVRLYNVLGTRQYELPTAKTVGAIVFIGASDTENEFDLIVEEHSRLPQRVNKLHPCYMSLQFPLLFIYGEDGYHKDMKLANVLGQSTKGDKRMSMNMYYSYQIHDRLNHYSLLLRGGKLFQQYIVTAYCAIEQNRLDYIRQKQSNIRNEYLSGIYDAIVRGDRDGGDLALRTVLTASFTGEIEEFMEPFPQLTTTNRADIVDRVFEKKVRDYVNFVRNSNTFGDVTAELLDPITDADGYVVVSELMIHGLCGAVNMNASCKKDGTDRVVANVTKLTADISSISKTPSIQIDEIKNYAEASSMSSIGLLGEDGEWIGAFQEATLSATALELRKLFVHILIFCNVADPMNLWQRLWKDMSDDIPHRLSKSLRVPETEKNEKKIKATVLLDLEAMLNSYSKSLKDFGLPPPLEDMIHILQNRFLMEETNYNP
ncbi:DNA helicase [Tanacetum coccineum]